MINKLFLLLKLFFSRDGYKRAEILKKNDVLFSIGEHCYCWPINYGTEPWLLSFGNNVFISTGVRFVTHDMASDMFSYMDNKQYTTYLGKINIGDNVLIGSDSIILYDTYIGDNVIIAAGSVVKGYIEPNSIYAGIPAKKIGNFEDYRKKIADFTNSTTWKENEKNREIQVEYFWKDRGN